MGVRDIVRPGRPVGLQGMDTQGMFHIQAIKAVETQLDFERTEVDPVQDDAFGGDEQGLLALQDSPLAELRFDLLEFFVDHAGRREGICARWCRSLAWVGWA